MVVVGLPDWDHYSEWDHLYGNAKGIPEQSMVRLNIGGREGILELPGPQACLHVDSLKVERII